MTATLLLFLFVSKNNIISLECMAYYVEHKNACLALYINNIIYQYYDMIQMVQNMIHFFVDPQSDPKRHFIP